MVLQHRSRIWLSRSSFWTGYEPYHATPTLSNAPLLEAAPPDTYYGKNLKVQKRQQLKMLLLNFFSRSSSARPTSLPANCDNQQSFNNSSCTGLGKDQSGRNRSGIVATKLMLNKFKCSTCFLSISLYLCVVCMW